MSEYTLISNTLLNISDDDSNEILNVISDEISDEILNDFNNSQPLLIINTPPRKTVDEIIDDMISDTKTNRQYKIYSKLYKKKGDTCIFRLVNDIKYNPSNKEAIYYLAKILCNIDSIYYDNKMGSNLMTFLSTSLLYAKATCFNAKRTQQITLKKNLFKKAAHNGNSYSKTWLARYYLMNNKQKCGIYWLKQAADDNYIGAINELGLIALKHGDYKESFNWYMKSHNLGNLTGTKHVGLAYKKGLGIEKDNDEAKKYIQIYYDKSKDTSVLML